MISKRFISTDYTEGRGARRPASSAGLGHLVFRHLATLVLLFVRAHRDILAVIMARRTLYLLIALLALQFSWSMVAAYCTHETGSAANHWGHHPHTNAFNEVASLLKEKPSGAKKTSTHSHCASCAHGALSIDSFESISHPLVTEAAPVSTEIILSSYPTAPPERPQWVAAA